MQYKINGERLRLARLDAKMSQADVVRLLHDRGVEATQAHLSAIELGSKGVASETLAAICDVLDLSLDYVMGLTNDASPRSDWSNQAILNEPDPVARETMQLLFSAIQRLPLETRIGYYDLLDTLYNGLVALQRRRIDLPKRK